MQASLAALEARLERVRLSAPPVAAIKDLVCCELPDGAKRAWISWTVAGALAVRADPMPTLFCQLRLVEHACCRSACSSAVGSPLETCDVIPPDDVRVWLAQALLALLVTVRLMASLSPAPSRQFYTAAPGGAPQGTQLVPRRERV